MEIVEVVPGRAGSVEQAQPSAAFITRTFFKQVGASSVLCRLVLLCERQPFKVAAKIIWCLGQSLLVMAAQTYDLTLRVLISTSALGVERRPAPACDVALWVLLETPARDDRAHRLVKGASVAFQRAICAAYFSLVFSWCLAFGQALSSGQEPLFIVAAQNCGSMGVCLMILA